MLGRIERWSLVRRCGAPASGAGLVLAALVLPAFAQLPDVLSESECPECKAKVSPPPFDGVWSSALTAAAEPGWALEDFFCFAACTREGREQARRLLTGAATAHRPALELYPWAVGANIGSVVQLAGAPSPSPDALPGFRCDPGGFAVQVVSPLPLEIRSEARRVTFRYEEFGAERTISLHDDVARRERGRAGLGVSSGRIEGGALVVETSEIAAGRLSEWLGGFAHGDSLRAIERYSVSADGRWLDLALTLDDPAALAKPLVLTKRWVRAPSARIAHHGCDVMSAGLSGVFAEYLDPRLIEARRQLLD